MLDANGAMFLNYYKLTFFLLFLLLEISLQFPRKHGGVAFVCYPRPLLCEKLNCTLFIPNNPQESRQKTVGELKQATGTPTLSSIVKKKVIHKT